MMPAHSTETIPGEQTHYDRGISVRLPHVIINPSYPILPFKPSITSLYMILNPSSEYILTMSAGVSVTAGYVAPGRVQ